MKRIFGHFKLVPAGVLWLAAAMLAGCASSGVKNPSGVEVTQMNPDMQGFVAGTGVESQDVVEVTDFMARKILSTPEIANAVTPPYIVLEPIKNNTRFPINKEAFLTRIRSQLNMHAAGQVRFLARERMDALLAEREKKIAGEVTSTTDPNPVEFRGADYFLTGELQGMTTRTSQGTSDYIIYAFQLIDARTSVIVWEGAKEIKKQGLEDAAYR